MVHVHEDIDRNGESWGVFTRAVSSVRFQFSILNKDKNSLRLTFTLRAWLSIEK